MSDDQRLDMRYDTSLEDSSTAHDILNSSPEFDLAQIFKKFGEEKFAGKLAKAVIEER